MPVVISELATEIALPAYAGMTNGDIVVYINDRAGADSGTVDVKRVDPWQMVSSVVAAEYATLSALERGLWSDIVGLEYVPVEEAGLRSLILALWGAGTTTRANLAALQTRTGSRAEVLWGEGTAVTLNDVREAKGL